MSLNYDFYQHDSPTQLLFSASIYPLDIYVSDDMNSSSLFTVNIVSISGFIYRGSCTFA